MNTKTRLNNKLNKAVFIGMLSATLFLAGIIQVVSSNQGQSYSNQAITKNPALEYFTDIPLVTQDGESLRFYNDLLKNKVVIIHSFFSSCKSSCPVSMRLMAGIQERFNEKMGKELHILSISLDPETDTPLKLKNYAEELDVGPGWQLLSGDKQNVDLALNKIGHYVADIDSHKNTIIIGNEATGLWKKAFLMSSSEALDKVIRSVLEDKMPVTASVE